MDVGDDVGPGEGAYEAPLGMLFPEGLPFLKHTGRALVPIS